MNLIYHWLFPGAWMAFSVYWFGSALCVKRIQRGEPRHKRTIRFILTTLCAGLLISPRFGPGPLGWTVLPQTKTTFFTGAAMLMAGLGFAIWARLHLGAYWSAMVAVKEGHRLIRTGPYRLVRHPIYSGILTALAGTAVAEGQLRALMGAALLSAIYYRKSQDEERLLSLEFADEYPAYRKEVGALIPVSGRPQKIFWSAVAAVLLVTLRHALFSVVIFAGLMNMALARAEQPALSHGYTKWMSGSGDRLGVGHDRGTIVALEPFPGPPVTTEPAQSADEHVLKDAGATLPKRDEVDERVVRETRDGSGHIRKWVKEAGGWPDFPSATTRSGRAQ